MFQRLVGWSDAVVAIMNQSVDFFFFSVFARAIERKTERERPQRGCFLWSSHAIFTDFQIHNVAQKKRDERATTERGGFPIEKQFDRFSTLCLDIWLIVNVCWMHFNGSISSIWILHLINCLICLFRFVQWWRYGKCWLDEHATDYVRWFQIMKSTWTIS